MQMAPGKHTRLLVVALAVAALPGCGLSARVGCTLTDIPAGLASSDGVTRGKAAECAMNAAPDRIAPLVPALTRLLGDKTIYREYDSSGGLIGFGEAGRKSVIVAMPAMRAVERASPSTRNVSPLVDALVKAANQARPQRRGSSLYGDPESVASSLIVLLSTRYHEAGLRDEVADKIQAATLRIRNVAFWSDQDFNREISDLHDGRTPYPWDGSPAPSQPVSRAPTDVFPGTSATRPTPRGSGRGMTWGVLAGTGLAKGWIQVGCDGQPGDTMSHPRDGTNCDPYTGDMACAIALPVLCRLSIPLSEQQAARAETDPALRDRVLTLQYRTSTAIAGTSLESSTSGDELCTSQFGEGWRMAEHHDNDKGWGAIGRDAGVAGLTRFWVAINDQPGNCWNP